MTTHKTTLRDLEANRLMAALDAWGTCLILRHGVATYSARKTYFTHDDIAYTHRAEGMDYPHCPECGQEASPYSYQGDVANEFTYSCDCRAGDCE